MFSCDISTMFRLYPRNDPAPMIKDVSTDKRTSTRVAATGSHPSALLEITDPSIEALGPVIAEAWR